MTDVSSNALSNRSRGRLIAAAGAVIILLSAGAALLPGVARGPGTLIVGWMLFFAGLVELLAGSLRRAARLPAMAAGAVTLAAGLPFILGQPLHFLPTVYVIVAWLLIRSGVLLYAAQHLKDAARMWTLIATGTDFLLALLLLLGLSIATLVVSLFGPTPVVVASFAWVLALSFVATGFLLFEVSGCERDDDTAPSRAA